MHMPMHTQRCIYKTLGEANSPETAIWSDFMCQMCVPSVCVCTNSRVLGIAPQVSLYHNFLLKLLVWAQNSALSLSLPYYSVVGFYVELYFCKLLFSWTTFWHY